MKRRGTTLLELLVAITIVTIGLFAVMRTILVVANASRSLIFKNEAKLIAKTHIDRIEANAKTNFLGISDMTWTYENNDPIYGQMGINLSRSYFVQEKVKFVVTQYVSGKYKKKDFIDTDNDQYDDVTEQGKDMKEITVTVAWPEAKRKFTESEVLNALFSNNQTYKDKNRMRYFSLSTVISSYNPQSKACCHNPTINSVDIIPNDTPLQVSHNYTVRATLKDECIKRPSLTLRYWYYNESFADAKSIEMKTKGNVTTFYADVPGSEIKEKDNDCIEDGSNTTDYDMSFRVVARDDYIGPNCNVTSRTTTSDTLSKNVADSEPPTISDNSLKNVACHAVIRATILDGANGKDGVSSVIAGYAKMDSGGIHSSLVANFDSKTGPDAEGRYTWELKQEEVQDWSMPDTDPTTFDNKPDLYYEITAYDTCGNSTTIPVNADDHSTEITVTEKDVNPPEIVLNYDGNGFEDCVPFGSEDGIQISFDVIDDCEVTTTAYVAIPWEVVKTATSTTDLSAYIHEFNVYTNWMNITDTLHPTSRNDFWFRTRANDSSGNETYNPAEEVGHKVIHQGNALWYANVTEGNPYPYDVTLSSPYEDTITLSLVNNRDGDIYLDSLYLKEPAYKNICLSTGDTTVIFPYVDTITLESQNSDASDYKKNVIWDWKNDDPTPGTRDIGPIVLYFNKENTGTALISGFGREVKISIHFMDRATDGNTTALPFSIKECDFDLIFQSDQSKEYKCDNEFIFSTKTTGLHYSPVANAGIDKRTAVDAWIYFDGTMSKDCDNDIETYQWDFADGSALVTGATAYHIYTSTYYETLKGTSTDTSPVVFNTILTVIDSFSPPGSDTDTRRITLYGGDDNQSPKIASFACNQAMGKDKFKIIFSIVTQDIDDDWLYYNVDFGDTNSNDWGDITGMTTTSHTYLKETITNTATLTVTDTAGNTDSASINVECEKTGTNAGCSCN